VNIDDITFCELRAFPTFNCGYHFREIGAKQTSRLLNRTMLFRLNIRLYHWWCNSIWNHYQRTNQPNGFTNSARSSQT